MEGRPERGSLDEAQKMKLIFISLAIVVTILLIISFVSGNKARAQRDDALKQVQTLKEDNAKLSQWLEERTQEVERYKKTLEDCRSHRTTHIKVKHTSKKSSKKASKKRTKKKARR